MGNIVKILKTGFEMATLPVHIANIPFNLVMIHGRFPFLYQYPDYRKWQYYALGDGLAILNGEPPNKTITWFLNEKDNDAVKMYTYGRCNVQWT